MKTRSQTQSQTQSQTHFCEIDFDEASREWLKNKKSIGNGQYKYICCQQTKKGNPCNRKSLPSFDFCKLHKKP
jgi:hypothetical protein